MCVVMSYNRLSIRIVKHRPRFTEKCKLVEVVEISKAIYRFLSRAIIYYTENGKALAGSPGYLDLMTTQERLATLLVRVSYPGALLFLSQEETGLNYRHESV